MILTAEQILKTQRHRTELVDVGDGQQIRVRGLPLVVIEESQKIKNSEAYIFCRAVIGEDGNRLFADEQADELAENISTGVLQLVASKAMSISLVSPARRAEIKKNLEITEGGISGESPSHSDIPTQT